MTHRNARLTPVTRAELVEQVLSGWPQAEVARLFRVSRATVTKWVRRFREGGPDALLDRSSRPLRSPRQTGQLQEAAICAARRMLAWGPHRIGWRLGIAPSTVYAVLRRAGLHRLAWLHRTTREIVRYEHARPGALVHLDIKKLGRIPQGGGKRILPGFAETHSGPQRGPRLGFDFLHVAVDDHSRYAYVEALPDERGPTAAAFLVRALAHFERQSIAVERILTDNGACYVSRIFTDTAAARNIRVKRTRPFRPQTNGKAEAFNKIMQAEWAYQRPYYSNDERLNVLPGFLAYYNHRRPHGGIGGTTPAVTFRIDGQQVRRYAKESTARTRLPSLRPHSAPTTQRNYSASTTSGRRCHQSLGFSGDWPATLPSLGLRGSDLVQGAELLGVKAEGIGDEGFPFQICRRVGEISYPNVAEARTGDRGADGESSKQVVNDL